ncbi:MAG TPA: Uma2 family endonuclease [Pyrinomonadaceae bacterium]|jgi:Uma2 family endonuclease
MALPKTYPVFSIAEYLDFERYAESRHEFLDGTVYAIAGESPRHSTICFNLYGITGNQLRGKRWLGFSPNIKVATGDRGLFSYPDLAIVCGEPLYHDDKQDVLTNPQVIFEVLSPSTQNYDRGEKFLRYTNTIETLTDYVLISQDAPFVEHFQKQADGDWLKSEVSGLESILHLAGIECEIPLSELYYLVDFS